MNLPRSQKQVHDLLYDLHACQSWQELEHFGLERVHQLFGASRSSWTEFVDHQNFNYTEWSADHKHLKGEYTPVIKQYLQLQHPLITNFNPTERWTQTYRITDFMTQREFEKTELYNEGYLPTGIRHQVTMQAHVSAYGFTTFSVSRLDKRITDTERTLFDNLQPHFQLVTQRLLREQQLKETLAGSRIGDRHDIPVIAFGSHWIIYEANETGLALLKSIDDFDGQHLPSPIVRALRGSRDHTAVIGGSVVLGGCCYSIHGNSTSNPLFRFISLTPQAAHTLLAQRTERAKLSPRELDVAHWVQAGKSNREIGIILGISSRTVGKHLEHIFEKLNVENRYGLMPSTGPDFDRVG